MEPKVVGGALCWGNVEMLGGFNWIKHDWRLQHLRARSVKHQANTDSLRWAMTPQHLQAGCVPALGKREDIVI